MKLAIALIALTVQAQTVVKTISPSDCTKEKLGGDIARSAIGEPVSAVHITAVEWKANWCSLDGTMLPIETGSSARPILFRVLLPSTWTGRAAQLGGGGNNGVIPNLTGHPNITTGAPPLERGFVTYGSDSGHDMRSTDWALSDEAIRNLGYMQMKKTHDAAMVLIQRAYGEGPRFNYYFGTSQGGREALTVAQRYPADYDGIIANVPIVNFSSLMLAPELIRIQEKPAANWVTTAKINAIRAEFMRQCDEADGLKDGIINNYVACRAMFQKTDAWKAKRCPDNIDPNPQDTSDAACLTDGQIATLKFVYRPYTFATPLANGVKSFGMWVPNTDPGGSGLIAQVRFRGQEGAAENAPMHTHLGVIGVTGYLMKNLSANPLDYVERGRWEDRRKQLSEWLDSTNPDLGRFAARGGKMIVTIGTNDTLASPGAQLDYYQSVIDKMGREKVDEFARFFVLPQTNHGFMGRTLTPEAYPVPNTYDRLSYLMRWVEEKSAPPMQISVDNMGRGLPMCSYPEYPRYGGGDKAAAGSYICTRP